MQLIRTMLFYALFYLSNAVQMIFWTPAFFIVPREDAWKIVRLWALSHLWLQHLVCGSRYDFRGLDRIPTGSLLVASKHQSSWETYTMTLFFSDASFVLKRQLMHIPFFGWYVAKMKVVPVDRGKRSLALVSMTDSARRLLAKMDLQIIIYPEGTRRKAGAEPRYKYGITHLYLELSVPVVPVALNSGLYWGRHSPQIYPGTIVMKFLDPIAPGLDKDAFSQTLQDTIETATAELIGEAARSSRPPPLALELAGGSA